MEQCAISRRNVCKAALAGLAMVSAATNPHVARATSLTGIISSFLDTENSPASPYADIHPYDTAGTHARLALEEGSYPLTIAAVPAGHIIAYEGFEYMLDPDTSHYNEGWISTSAGEYTIIKIPITLTNVGSPLDRPYSPDIRLFGPTGTYYSGVIGGDSRDLNEFVGLVSYDDLSTGELLDSAGITIGESIELVACFRVEGPGAYTIVIGDDDDFVATYALVDHVEAQQTVLAMPTQISDFQTYSQSGSVGFECAISTDPSSYVHTSLKYSYNKGPYEVIGIPMIIRNSSNEFLPNGTDGVWQVVHAYDLKGEEAPFYQDFFKWSLGQNSEMLPFTQTTCMFYLPYQGNGTYTFLIKNRDIPDAKFKVEFDSQKARDDFEFTDSIDKDRVNILPQASHVVGGFARLNLDDSTILIHGLLYKVSQDQSVYETKTLFEGDAETTVIKIPVTVTNLSDQFIAPSNTYVRVFGPAGHNMNLRAEKGSLSKLGIINPGDSVESYVRFTSEGPGTYILSLGDADDFTSVSITVDDAKATPGIPVAPSSTTEFLSFGHFEYAFGTDPADYLIRTLRNQETITIPLVVKSHSIIQRGPYYGLPSSYAAHFACPSGQESPLSVIWEDDFCWGSASGQSLYPGTETTLNAIFPYEGPGTYSLEFYQYSDHPENPIALRVEVNI
ncbi:MAG: hypothetical protein IKE43_10505 [Coriobacteriales bacterium]|nr:hypothetical protein [Coriobacteriales bacterium]